MFFFPEGFTAHVHDLCIFQAENVATLIPDIFLLPTTFLAFPGRRVTEWDKIQKIKTVYVKLGLLFAISYKRLLNHCKTLEYLQQKHSMKNGVSYFTRILISFVGCLTR